MTNDACNPASLREARGRNDARRNGPLGVVISPTPRFLKHDWGAAMRMLFDDLPAITASPTRIARRDDPDTSHFAASEISQRLLASQKLAILRFVVRRGGLTSLEIARESGIDRYVVARRLPDLRKDGLVSDTGSKRDLVTGRLGRSWIATARGLQVARTGE